MENRYTDGTYLNDNPGWHGADSAWKLSHVLRALKNTGIDGTRLKTVCDAGCGAGEVIKLWAKELPQTSFYGYDVSPQALELALRDKPQNCIFRLGSALRPEPCNALLLLDVLEHIPDWKAFFKEWTAQAERIVIHMPLDLSVYARLRPSILARERQTVGHIHFFTARTFLRELDALGMRVLHLHYTNKYVERPPQMTRFISRAGMFIRQAAHKFLPRAWAAYWVGGYSLMLVLEKKPTPDTSCEAV
uniref:Class I SAM-dependent methyltransferase n=1 Tax=uncultured Elusimicrobia bacterium TaxID=699876 RepID=A0A650EM07_9BACT|nr:hypothetical protein Elusimicrob2101_1200 [uncultured Elusimicrobia bacterium]